MRLYRLLARLTRLLARSAFRADVRGVEHVPEGGFVLAATHLSGFDILAIAAALAPRPLHYMAKRQLFGHPLIGPLITTLGAFPAVGGDEAGVMGATALACAGEAVVIFPEGARRRLTDRRRARTGAAHAALASGVPLVPAALRGTDGWRRMRRWQLAVGPPIQVDGLSGLEPARAARQTTRRLWEAITALEAELER